MFGYSLLAPAVLYMVLLVGIPFFFSLYLALSDATVGNQVASYVGLANFVAIFNDGSFRQALRNSIVFTVVAGIFKIILGTLMAFLLVQEVRGKKLIRSLVVIPWTLPVAISALAWKWMYDPQFSAINYVGTRLHLIQGWPNWLGEPGLAMAAVISVNVWRGFPFAAIVLMAGMSAVPVELLDAAKVDGATFLTRYRFIIIPVIAPILFVGLLFDTVFTLSDISIVYLLTFGGPMGSTEILPTKAFEIGIQAGALGRGAAISLVLFPILLPVVYLLLRNLRRREAL
ncbi:MAG TPA: sugar ABC transporter permease [bacterium]|nr:sugar ABC transporter permease [bacterium]